MSLRYFVSRPGAAAPPPDRDEPQALRDALALLRLGRRDLVVGTDVAGQLRAADASDRAALTPEVQAQLAYHEVTAARDLVVAADELHLFDVQMIELLRDAPGLNDPIYLYGTVRGPYPAALAAEVPSVDGQLTTTRADLLAGLVAGVEDAFLHRPGLGGARCVHALLPGAPVSEIDRGRGLVLAFPLAHLELGEEPPNELLAAQTFYDVLRALRAELGEGRFTPLAVPSRTAHEAELVAAGWTIDGDRAVRRRRKGLLGALAGKDVLDLPRQATLEDYVREARAHLPRLNAPATALSRRTHAARSGSGGGKRTRPPEPAAAPGSAARQGGSTPRTEWMREMVDAHRASTVARPARVLQPAAVPDWTRDYDASKD